MTYLASSAGALITDRNTWHSRADQAWGSSRVWNTGSSFETDLAAMTTDRNTWHTRADQAWGASRVWNSGESWEAAYNRVLPPAAPVTRTTSGSGGNGTIMSTTTDRAGYWVAMFNGSVAAGASANPVVYAMTGALTDSGQMDASGTATLGGDIGLTAGPTFCAAGAAVSITCNDQGNISGALTLVFIPTQAYPH